MNWTHKAWVLWSLGLAAVFAQGCSSEAAEEEEVEEGELNVSKPGQWVVDMAKVKSLYGQTSKYFFGLGPEEVGLCKVDANGVPEAACAQVPPVWDQVFHYNEDHTMVDPRSKAPVVKLEDGKILEVQGARLNIIPLFKDTDPADQAHLRAYMQNGDVLVFFHPEQRDQRGMMDGRASHVAMHYDYKRADGQEFVHHIDNPNSYGPQYNYAPDRQMPFHVFRYKPKGMSAEQSKAVGLNARNYAFMNDDRSPFADFFTLTLQSYDDLKTKFLPATVKGEQIPNVYCSGLAYTNLNLGANFKLTPDKIRSEGYSRAETEETLKADVLAPAATQGIQELGRLIFEPYTTSELTNAWIDRYFSLLPAVAEEGKPSRRAIANNPKTIAGIMQGLSSLAWSDAERDEKTAHNTPPSKVASEGRIKAWADAYGLDATQTQAWLSRNAEIAAEVTDERVDVTGKTPMQVLKEVELKTVKNRFVGPRIWMDEADHRQWAADPRMLPSLPVKAETDMIYVGTVINCELLASADPSKPNARPCYNPNAGRIKEFSEGGADTSTYPHYAIANGGERTHRRFDASPFSRGKDRDGNDSPRSMGKGSKIEIRATATEAADMMVLFHTPAENETLPEELKKLSVKDYDKACTKMYSDAAQASRRASCAPKEAIVLDLAKSQEVKAGWGKATGQIVDQTYTFDLTDVCQLTAPDKMKCTVAQQKADGSGWEVVGEKEISRAIPKTTKKGLVSATLVDKGTKSEGAAVDQLCPACQAGGAHFNQWVVTIRDDR